MSLGGVGGAGEGGRGLRLEEVAAASNGVSGHCLNRTWDRALHMLNAVSCGL
jgi:hypothetical protein